MAEMKKRTEEDKQREMAFFVSLVLSFFHCFKIVKDIHLGPIKIMLICSEICK